MNGLVLKLYIFPQAVLTWLVRILALSDFLIKTLYVVNISFSLNNLEQLYINESEVGFTMVVIVGNRRQKTQMSHHNLGFWPDITMVLRKKGNTMLLKLVHCSK